MANKPLQTIKEIKPNSFVFEKPNVLPKEFCADVIARFETDQEGQYKGRVGQLAKKK